MLSFSIILLTISSSCIILLIIEQLRLPCCLLVLYCSRLAVLVLYCSSLSRCDFHVDIYYYTAHQWALLILYCSLVSSCDLHVDLYSGILDTPIILWDLAAGKAAWDQTCLNIILLIDEQFSYYTAHHWAVVISMLAYIVAYLPLAGS
jgi:hypothetical protein